MLASSDSTNIHHSHLRARYIAHDANFRLKRKDKKRSIDDGGLVRGAGYFSEPDLFSQELKRVKQQKKKPEKSSCDSSFAAIERADSRINKGYAVTGVVAAIDVRHGWLLANGVADLQRGEAYVTFLSLKLTEH
jgi:hypothetical protein